MAYDTARFELFSPRWTSATQRDPAGVRVSHAVLEKSSTSTVVRQADVAAWLEERGFTVPEGGRARSTIANLRVDSTVFVSGDIEVSLGSHQGELMDGLLQFTLQPTPPPVDGWEAFTAELCARWGLSIFDRETSAKVDARQFRRLLGQRPQWRLFAGSHGWSAAALPAVQGQRSH